MTNQETLELALNALKCLFGLPDKFTGEGGDVAVWRLGGSYRAQEAIKALEEALAKQEQGEPVATKDWEGAEYWMPLAWGLCADECGEDACNELIWEGSPIPEPWGDRWLKYEDEAKRLISIVYKHTTPQQRTWVGLDDDDCHELWESTDSDWELMKRVEAKLKEKNGL